MAGVTMMVEDPGVVAALGKLVQRAGDVHLALATVADEVLRPSTERRFQQMVSPEGVPWAPLSPDYARRKKRHPDKILTLNGYLRENMVAQIEGNTLEFGSNRKYAAIHQFGGPMRHGARRQTLAFDKGGRFLSHKKASKRKTPVKVRFAEISGHETDMTARPFLGLSGEDKRNILEILGIFLEEPWR